MPTSCYSYLQMAFYLLQTGPPSLGHPHRANAGTPTRIRGWFLSMGSSVGYLGLAHGADVRRVAPNLGLPPLGAGLYLVGGKAGVALLPPPSSKALSFGVQGQVFFL